MPVINAHCPADQATLAALYKHKDACFSAHKNARSIEQDAQRIFAMNRLADRRTAVEALATAQSEAYQTNVKNRLIELTEARKAHNKSQLAASTAKLEALKYLEEAVA